VSCDNCKKLEAILLEYVERYGLTKAAREYFEAAAKKKKDK
jgi:hypothetical protein